LFNSVKIKVKNLEAPPWKISSQTCGKVQGASALYVAEVNPMIRRVARSMAPHTYIFSQFIRQSF